MNEKKLEFFGLYVHGKIDKHTYLMHYLKDSSNHEQYILNLFEEGFDYKDAGIVQLALALSTDVNTNSPIFVNILCKVLSEDWHFSHEDIATWLKDIKDPSATKCLHIAATLKVPYLDYDDTFQLSRKCIKALASFKTLEAKESLVNLSRNSNPIIAEYATKELNRMD